MTIALVGKGRPVTLDELSVYHQWWTVGTHPLAQYSDLVFEVHNIPLGFACLRLDDLKYLWGRFPTMPFHSSMDYMMASVLDHSRLWGHLQIDILASPMRSEQEYIIQRASLGYWIGYAIAKGCVVNWKDGIGIGHHYMEG